MTRIESAEATLIAVQAQTVFALHHVSLEGVKWRVPNEDILGDIHLPIIREQTFGLHYEIA